MIFPFLKELRSACLFALIVLPRTFADTAYAQPDKLVERGPWLTMQIGPENAKGVIYYIRGWGFPTGNGPMGGVLLDSFQLLPYFIKTLSEQGWDVIAAKYPNRPIAKRSSEL